MGGSGCGKGSYSVSIIAEVFIFAFHASTVAQHRRKGRCQAITDRARNLTCTGGLVPWGLSAGRSGLAGLIERMMMLGWIGL